MIRVFPLPSSPPSGKGGYLDGSILSVLSRFGKGYGGIVLTFLQFSLGIAQSSPNLKWKRPLSWPSSLLQASIQAPQFTHETSRLFFLGATAMKQTFSHCLQSVHSCIRPASSLSRKDTGLTQPKSVCMSPAAQMYLQKVCLTSNEVTNI